MRYGKSLCLLAALAVLAGAGWEAGASAGPNITNAELKYLGSPEPEIDIYGSGFGAVQGTKNVRVDGALVTAMPGWSVIHWSDTSVSLQGYNLIPWEHVYQIAITEGSTVISNVLSKRFFYTIDGINPGSGMPGVNVKVAIWDLPAAPGLLVLKLGANNFPIVTWGSPITAKVPSVAAGKYEVFLMKGRNIVSKKTPFTVLKLFIKVPLEKIK